MLSWFSQKMYKIFEDRSFLEKIIYLCVYVLQKVTYFEIFRMMTLASKQGFPPAPEDSQFTFLPLPASQLPAYTYNTQRLPASFLEECRERGDMLYGCVLAGTKELVSYGWYSSLPTKINHHLEFHFPTDYVYMFNGYTEVPYRGYRLHGRGMGEYAFLLGQQGKKGLISYVNGENYRSLRSCARLGYEIVGTIVALRLGRKTYLFATSGCKKAGVSLKVLSHSSPSAI